MQTEQLLCWSGMTDTTSGSTEAAVFIYYMLKQVFLVQNIESVEKVSPLTSTFAKQNHNADLRLIMSNKKSIFTVVLSDCFESYCTFTGTKVFLIVLVFVP